MYRPAIVFILLITIQLSSRPMPWRSKGELLITGSITDTIGYRYNVMIVPGYVNSGKLFSTQFRRGANNQFKGIKHIGIGLRDIPLSTKHLGIYFSEKPWRGMADGIGDMADGTELFMGDFIGEGVPKTWHNYMGSARTLRERGTIGWRISYPFFFVRSLLNTTMRVTGGTIATAGAVTYGILLRPTYELLYPIGKTVGYMGFNTGKAVFGTGEITWGAVANYACAGIVAPISMGAWNTAVGIPLSLVSATPTPQSTHRLWVTVDSSSLMNSFEDRVQFDRFSTEFAQFEETHRRKKAEVDSIAQALSPTIYELSARADSLSNVMRILRHREDSLRTIIRNSRDAQESYRYNSRGSYRSVAEQEKLYQLITDRHGDTAVDTTLLREFIRYRGGEFIKPAGAVDRNGKKYHPSTMIGDELDAIIDGSDHD